MREDVWRGGSCSVLEHLSFMNSLLQIPVRNPGILSWKSHTNVNSLQDHLREELIRKQKSDAVKRILGSGQRVAYLSLLCTSCSFAQLSTPGLLGVAGTAVQWWAAVVDERKHSLVKWFLGSNIETSNYFPSPAHKMLIYFHCVFPKGWHFYSYLLYKENVSV